MATPHGRLFVARHSASSGPCWDFARTERLRLTAAARVFAGDHAADLASHVAAARG